MNETVRIAGDESFLSQARIHPLGLSAIIILCLWVFFLKRRWSVIPFLVMACFISSAQKVVIANADFYFWRLLVIVGVARIFVRKEYILFVMKPLDKAIILWTLSSMIFFIMREGGGAIVNRLGFAVDVLGMYFFFRCMIQDWGDVEIVVKTILMISLPLAVLFIFENRTGRNLFSIFGGVPEITVVREDRLRCQGPYDHPILAGCFWAALIPLIAANWWQTNKSKVLVVISLFCSMVIIICCASSTPLMGVISAIIGGLFFFVRYQLRIIRWVFLLTIIMLHMIMKAPVWYLIGRMNILGSSAGYHRCILVDKTIEHFGDWWFYGCFGYTIASWGIWAGDVTNQYIMEGVSGGIVTLCLFVAIIIIAYREVGYLWRRCSNNHYHLALSWALGVSLFVHCINFIGVAYFGQIIIIWYLLLAIIGSLSLSPKLALSKYSMRQPAIKDKNCMIK